MPSDRRPSPEFVAALGITPTSVRLPGIEMELLHFIQMMSISPSVLPAWTRAPGEPPGLAALAAIARELGFSVEWQTESCITLVQPERNNHHITISSVGWYSETTGWVYWDQRERLCDPAALEKLLHQLLAARPLILRPAT